VFLTKMLRAGYHPQHEPYLASMLQTFRATQLLNLRTRSRIFVPKGILARVVTGPVVVAKNPCVHPGDVRVLMAVDEPSLHHMVNCLVFPQNGDRYSMMPIIKSTALKLNNFFLKSRRVEAFYVRKPKCMYTNVGSL
jgi:hypothetical protein